MDCPGLAQDFVEPNTLSRFGQFVDARFESLEFSENYNFGVIGQLQLNREKIADQGVAVFADADIKFFIVKDRVARCDNGGKFAETVPRQVELLDSVLINVADAVFAVENDDAIIDLVDDLIHQCDHLLAAVLLLLLIYFAGDELGDLVKEGQVGVEVLQDPVTLFVEKADQPNHSDRLLFEFDRLADFQFFGTNQLFRAGNTNTVLPRILDDLRFT